MPENRNEVDTFKIVYFIENSGWDVDSDETGTDFFTGTYDEAVEYAKNQIREEWKDKVELISGYVDFDTHGCTTAYFDLENGKEITEEEAEARDYEVGIRTEGFDIYWDYPEKEEQVALSSQRKKALNIRSFDREDLENLFRSWIGEEYIRKPLEEWSTEDIIYELEEYQKLLIESKTMKDMGSLIADEVVIRPSDSLVKISSEKKALIHGIINDLIELGDVFVYMVKEDPTFSVLNKDEKKQDEIWRKVKKGFEKRDYDWESVDVGENLQYWCFALGYCKEIRR